MERYVKKRKGLKVNFLTLNLKYLQLLLSESCMGVLGPILIMKNNFHRLRDLQAMYIYISHFLQMYI